MPMRGGDRQYSSDRPLLASPNRGLPSRGGWQETSSMRSSKDELRKSDSERNVLGHMGGSGKGWNTNNINNNNKEREREANDNERRSNEPASKTSKPSKTELTQEVLEQRTDSLIEELIMSHETEDAIATVKSSLDTSYYPDMINQVISSAFERKMPEQTLLRDFIVELFKSELVTTLQLVSGLKKVTEIFEDLVIDIPKAPLILGSFFAHFINKSVFPLGRLANVLEPLIEIKSNQLESLLAETFHSLVQLEGEEETVSRYRQSKLKLESFIIAKQRSVSGFLKDHHLSFLEPGPASNGSGSSG